MPDMRTCAVDGVLYKEEPATDICGGCAGQKDGRLCEALRNCMFPNDIIWVRAEA